MIQKFKMTTFAAVLCLFGLMLFTAAPVFADPQGEFDDCKEMEKGKGKNRLSKLRCFKDLAEELIEINKKRFVNVDTCEIVTLLKARWGIKSKTFSGVTVEARSLDFRGVGPKLKNGHAGYELYFGGKSIKDC